MLALRAACVALLLEACRASAGTPPAPPGPASAQAPTALPAAATAPSDRNAQFKVLPDQHSDFPLSVTLERTRGPLAIRKVLEQPGYALAVDREPHVALLGRDEIHVGSAKGFRSEALPAEAVGEQASLRRIFYGRDYRVRLLFDVTRGSAGETRYFRLMPDGFRRQPDELGPLAQAAKGDTAGADRRLIALLGTADPEIVCRNADLCLIKRQSGWANVKPPADLRLVAIDAGRAFALAGSALFELENDKRWKSLSEAGPWKVPRQLFVAGGRAWVLERDEAKLYAFDGASWTTIASPVGAPHAIWGGAADALWLGGQAGLAFFDGHAWRIVDQVTGTVYAVLGRTAQDLWFAGDQGLFHGVP